MTQGRPWRPRAAVVAVLGAMLVAILALSASEIGCGSGGDGSGTRGRGQHEATQAAAQRKPPPQLPGGGRTILPRARIVAFYGAPQTPQLGTLGRGTPDQAAARLARVAKRYRPFGRPVLPTMELLATIANASPGPDGLYRTRQPDRVIARYLRAARKRHMLLLLDIQPGRADFLRESRHLLKWLREPDVSLALDPEWKTPYPGKRIGSVDAREVNAVSAWLEGVVQRGDLPQKLFLLHRFTSDMIRHDNRLKTRPHLALTVNVDGFGGQQIKREKYREFAGGRRNRGVFHGFKLFFTQDTGLMTPSQAMRLRPRPDVINYQ